MALCNFIIPGTYTTVAVTFNKQDKIAEIHWTTYLDSSKTTKFASSSILCDGRMTYVAVNSATTNRPDIGELGDRWITSDGQLHLWITENAGWGANPLNVGQVFYVEDTSSYVTWTGSELVAQPQAFDSRKWEEWFSIADLQGVDEGGRPRDLLRRCYEYLASRPEFAACTEC